MSSQKDDNKIRLDGMLLIGSAGRKCGKTTLVCQIIQKFRKKNITAIKITLIGESDKDFHHDLSVVGTKEFIITEETRINTKKDTSRMLAAGASKVFWLRAEKRSLRKGFAALLERIGADAVCICESNSLRQIVEPGLFIMIKERDGSKVKQSAKEVLNLADKIISFYDDGFDNFLKDLRLADGKWLILKRNKNNTVRD
jgi:molybdopterin-guanine dinucleotide biosynthesis protein